MIFVKKAGIETLVEDFPGRLGLLSKGMSTSGGMDNLSLRLANLIVGNSINDATLEIAGGYFEAEFLEDTVITIVGADMQPTINGSPIPMWESVYIKKGDLLKMSVFKDYGFRSYIGVAGGIDVPVYLGSKSTCVFGNYGGFEGRALKENDVIKTGKPSKKFEKIVGRKLKQHLIPTYTHVWEIKAIPGPNTSPDYVTQKGMDYLFDEEHKVKHTSNRSAYRLEDVPLYFFAREDGGEGGSHPSNIVDHGYAVPGTLNICGNTPIILCVDGPTLGGYINTLQIIYAELWKIGQTIPLKDKIKFIYCTQSEAIELRKQQIELFSENSIEFK
ncbi:MAG: biotin-dependent carboxyltransferase family protein [Candidatus Micrarchaeaceae archaeon]